MDLQLENKVVLVTGGAKGIGAAIVRGAVSEGAIAVILDRDETAAANLCAELRSAGGARCEQIGADLCDAASCGSAVKETLQKLGRLDVLVNNAGVNDKVGLESGSPEKYEESLRKNLHHYYNMAHYALSALKEARGCIVNIASKTAVTGQGGTSGYASAKGAILALTREWAVELLPYEIRVNAVVPAEVMTPLYEHWLATFANPEEKRKGIVAKIPLSKRMTKPEEIAAAVLFLISGQASHITGQQIFVDGGYVHLDRALT